jgi:hypothetical protein
MLNRRVLGFSLIAMSPLPFAWYRAASAQTETSPNNDAVRRNRRMTASRVFGGGPVPIPVAPEFGGLLTRFEQPSVFFLLKSGLAGIIRFTLQREGEDRPVCNASLGIAWSAGLHQVRFADLDAHLAPATRFDWTLDLHRVGHDPVTTGATIIYRRASVSLAARLAALPAPAAVDLLQQGGYWYDAFLCAMQAPAGERDTLTHDLLAHIDIDPS